jgi:hypothetical protein
MKADAQTPRRPDGQGTRTIEAALAAGVALALAAGPAAAQRLPERFGQAAAEHGSPVRVAESWRSTAGPPRRGLLAQVVVGTAGSVVGMIGGAYLGRGVCEVTSPCDGEDPGMEHAFVGIIAGSVVGTAAGTALGASLVRVPAGSFGRRLLGATLGLLAGAAAFQVLGGDADYVLPLATFTVTQALVTALWAQRPSPGAPR